MKQTVPSNIVALGPMAGSIHQKFSPHKSVSTKIHNKSKKYNMNTDLTAGSYSLQ